MKKILSKGHTRGSRWIALPVLALAVLLVQRRWMLFFAAGTFFARIPLVFLTAPDTYFMYYLTPFIAGYAVAAAAVLYTVLKRKLKSERITG